MLCVKCKKEGKIKVQNQFACKDCFLKIIEKRIRKELRINELVRKNDKILIIDDGTNLSLINEYLLKRIIKNLPVTIKLKKLKYKLGDEVTEEFNKVIIPWSADRENEYFLGSIFENEKMNYLGHFVKNKKTYIKLLLPILDEEIKMLAKILKFKGKDIINKSDVSSLIEGFQSEYPEVKFSLLKSSREISKLEK